MLHWQSLFLILIGISFEFGDKIIVVFNRFIDGFDFTEDAGNVDRLDRFFYLINDFKQDGIMNILIGDGTGTTARTLGAPQGESQIGKIYVEWGFLRNFFNISLAFRNSWNFKV